MQRTICDRCGAVLRPEDKCTVNIMFAKFTKLNSKPVELCVPCSRELELFLKRRREGGRAW